MPQPDRRAATSLDAYYAEWERRARALDAEDVLDKLRGPDGRIDWRRLDPKDIAVQFGRPMTEEEFAAHRAARAAEGRALSVIAATK